MAARARHRRTGSFTKVLPFSSKPCFHEPKFVLELMQSVDYLAVVEAAWAAIASFTGAAASSVPGWDRATAVTSAL